MKVSTLKKNPGNPRQIKGEKLDKLKASVGSFQKMMALRPLIVDENNIVLGGNMRLAAIKALGLKEIPDEWVKRADDLTEDEKAQFIITDNNSFGEYDWDAIANEWSDYPLADWGLDVPGFEAIDEPAGDADAEPQIDKAAELNKKWKVKSGDLWQIGEHRLLCGDSTTDAGRLMDGEKADCCVTDPPYGVLDNEWDRAFNQQDLDGIRAVTNGLIACFNAAKPAILLSMLSLEPTPERVGVWRHSHIAPKPGMIWSWQPVFYWQCGDAKAWDSLDWFQGNADRDGSHPTQKPIEFFAKIIGSVGGSSVYEPFAGSGTTLVACQNLNRKCYAIEISENYCAVILERMATAFPSLEIKRIEDAKSKGTN